MIKPVTQSESYEKASVRLASQTAVECRFPQSSEITEIIAVYPQVSCISCEASSGRVNYSGKVVFSLVYADESGKLCRMQKGVEFSHYADGDALAPSQTCLCRLSCDKTAVRREGSAFMISSVISADIEAHARVERTFLTSTDGAFLKKERVKLPSLVAFFGSAEVEDDFEVDGANDVLIPAAKVIVLACECSTGEIDVEGEIYLSLLAMRDGSPACLERIIPFRRSIPFDDSSSARTASVTAEISDLVVNASVNEEKGECAVEFSCGLNFSGVFCDEKEEEVATDAFSVTNRLDCEYMRETAVLPEKVRVYTQRVAGGATSKSKLGYDCRFLAAALPEVECGFVSGKVEGAASCTLIYEQGGEIKATSVSLPVSLALNGAAEEGQSVSLDVAVSGFTVRLKAEGEAEAEATLKICVTPLSERTVSYVCGVEEGATKSAEKSAVSVYLPTASDDLWATSKKLSSDPEELSARNPELVFPLTGKERIVVYRQKSL